MVLLLLVDVDFEASIIKKNTLLAVFGVKE